MAALAELSAPATTIDLYKAARDGYRLRLRRRRTSLALSGTAAVGVLGIAAAMLPVTHSWGKAASGPGTGTTAGSPPSTPQTPFSGSGSGSASGSGSGSAARKPSTVTVHVPARFGWLPPQLVYVDEGPSGSADYTAAAGTTDGKTFSELRIILKVQDAAPPAPTSKIPVAGIGTTAYWSAGAGPTAVAGRSDLVWRDASGKWLTLSSSHLDADTASAAAALEHVARTVLVGDIPLPLPIQIKGLPSTTVLSLNQAVLSHPVPGRPGRIHLNVGLHLQSFGVNVFVHSAGTVQGPWNGSTSACKDSDGWNVCVVADAHGAATLPGGVAGVLAHVEGLGTDPSAWTADFMVG